jgi:glycosidase
MKGKVYAFGNTDGNDIGRREAFDWYQSGAGAGMAFWYQNSGAWWTNANQKANDGISLEEQINNPNSLFNCYKKTIAFKQQHSALATGSYANAPNNNSEVYSFYRQSKKQKVLVLVNLSAEKQVVSLSDPILRAKGLTEGTRPYQEEISLAPFEWMVWEVK